MAQTSKSFRHLGSGWKPGIVPLENLEISERMRVTSFIISSMLTALMTLLATLSSIFRSRAALGLENLAVILSMKARYDES
jgi:hypothetical protein